MNSIDMQNPVVPALDNRVAINRRRVTVKKVAEAPKKVEMTSRILMNPRLRPRQLLKEKRLRVLVEEGPEKGPQERK